MLASAAQSARKYVQHDDSFFRVKCCGKTVAIERNIKIAPAPSGDVPLDGHWTEWVPEVHVPVWEPHGRAICNPAVSHICVGASSEEECGKTLPEASDYLPLFATAGTHRQRQLVSLITPYGLCELI